MRKIEAFWDASTVVPLCVAQANSAVVRAALQNRSVAVWWGTPVEVTAALWRLLRSGEVSQQQFRRALERLGRLRVRWTEVAPTPRLRELAEGLLERHTLRAADSLQLAAALAWCEERALKQHFMCLDRRLAEAALKEGFQVEAFGLTIQ